LIRNIFIIKDGVALVKLNFGKCHSIQENQNLVTGFISGLVSFSKEAIGSSIKTMTVDKYIFYFLKKEQQSGLLYVIVSEEDDEPEKIQFKMKKIADLFFERYGSKIENFDGEISRFNEFKELLIEMNLAKKNCGGRPECEGCPNSSKSAHFLEVFDKEKKSFFQRIKDFISGE
jgi:hypothetical protein